jgi:hypothetical protein
MRRIIWGSALFLSLLLFFLLFYRPQPLTKRKELEAASELQKVKRITEKQVAAEARRLGDSLVQAADSLLHHRLSAALAQGGLSAALQNYPPQQYPEIRARAQHYGITLSRTKQKPLATTAGSQVERVSAIQLLYHQPVYLQQALCLRCHGTVGQEVIPADLAVLRQKFPGYQATGYQAGTAIGSWEITFKRAAILRSLSARSRKSLRPRS